ncbi:MAG TPA: tetratricopeptide repeat protein, partial [Candidatus Omnitrophota bacterium]|nr:tetratricopeptide repeat protein [Candidatus Omnitrophota bacterium]
DAQVIDNGETVRQLLPGVKVTALYKAPFYRVKLDDGTEGWVESSKVKEPTDDLCLMGVRAYQNHELADAVGYFRQALQFDPRSFQSHFYLARIYLKQDKTDQAAAEVKEALAIEPDNARLKAMAEVLANKYLDEKQYAKVVDLKPELLAGRLSDKVKSRIVIEAKAPQKHETKVAQAVPAAPTAAPAVDKSIIADSINMVKNAKTGKGNSVYAAVNSVLTMTKSLGTKIYEDGWKVAAASDGVRVVYACRQDHGGKLENENFEWKVDPDHKSAIPLNENARLLMNRW